MLKRRINNSVIGLVLMVILLVGALPIYAQTVNEVELVGTLSAMTSTTVTINGQEISIIGAEINTALTIGNLVKVQGTIDATGLIIAREVDAPDDRAQNGEVEIVGVVESFDGTTMIVSGQSIDVTHAEVKAGVAIGELVKIHALSSGANTWQAREAELWMADDSSSIPVDNNSNDNTSDDTGPTDNSNDNNGIQVGEFELVGTLETIGDGFVVISGQTIDISIAEVKDMLVEGLLVKVHLSTVDGELIAREIENQFGNNNSNDNTAGDDNSNANSNDNTANNNGADDSNSNTDDNTGNSNDNSNSNSNDNISGDVAVSIDDATATVLSIYPNTTITEIELDDFADMLVWKIKTSHGIELQIDAQTGVILTIERDGNSGSSNNIGNSNANTDDNGSNSGMGSDDNSNNVSNSNDNNDDHGGKRNDNRNEDSNSGMGSDDDD